jgi:glycosyltransferase involved in cell wall biosynthesis
MYCSEKQRGRDWTVGPHDFSSEVLPGWACTIRREDGVVAMFNPTVWRRLSRVRAEVVIFGGYFQPTMLLGTLWCKFHKVPYMIHSESHGRNRRPVWRELGKRLLLVRLLEHSAANLVMGESSRAYLESYGARSETTYYFPNTPDVSHLAEVSSSVRATGMRRARDRFGIRGDLVILYLGRLIAVKRVGTLIRAFHKISEDFPNAALVIAGEGAERKNLETLAKQLGVANVNFLGVIQPNEAPVLYGCADVFALPSSAEPWGVVVLEAMACSLPVVVSTMVGASDVVQEGVTGFIVAPDDVAAWSAAFRRLLGDEALRTRLGRTGAEVAIKRDYQYCISQLRAALSAVVRPQ